MNGAPYPYPGAMEILLDQSRELRAQSHALGRIETELGHGRTLHQDLLATQRAHGAAISHLGNRVTSLEAAPVAKAPSAPSLVLMVLKAVGEAIMSLRELAVWAVLVGLSALAWRSPGDAKAVLLAMLEMLKAL